MPGHLTRSSDANTKFSDHGAMAKDKIGGVSYVCQTWKKEYSDHSVLPFFIGNRSAADHSLRHCLSDPVHKNVQKYGE